MLQDMRQPEMVQYLSLISHPNWKIDMAAKPTDVPQESFRKLSVD